MEISSTDKAKLRGMAKAYEWVQVPLNLTVFGQAILLIIALFYFQSQFKKYDVKFLRLEWSVIWRAITESLPITSLLPSMYSLVKKRIDEAEGEKQKTSRTRRSYEQRAKRSEVDRSSKRNVYDERDNGL